MPCPVQWLVITDGTISDGGIRNQIDLVSESGFCVLEEGDWRPAITMPKGGGVWKDSQLADGRRPADFKAGNVVESMTLTIIAQDQDALIRDTQELRRLLNKARTYGTTDWQSEPVWIEAQSPGESNMRYAIIWDWATPNDSNPYEQPFWQRVAGAGMSDFVLTLEREPYWRADEPGSGSCVTISGSQVYDEGPPWFLEFNGATSRVLITDNAAIQDLHDAAMTAEAWVRADDWGEANAGIIIAKDGLTNTGWRLFININFGVRALIDCAVQDAVESSGLGAFSPDSLWHHIAFTWDDAVDLRPNIWIDGVLSVAGGGSNRNGAIISDVGNDLLIGNNSAFTTTWEGDIGWCRVSDSIRYAATFTRPERCKLPAIDGNTVGQWIGSENTGATIDNQEGTAAIDGTQTDCTFDGCPPTYGRVDDPCLSETYITNKGVIRNLTHIYTWSAANGFSANLMTTPLPYDLIDVAGAAPAINDYVIFGIDSTLLNSEIFDSLVLDIGTAQTGMTLTWQVSTGGGAWAVPSDGLRDNTNAGGAMTGEAFDTTGVAGVYLADSTPMAANLVNGITGYWFRALVTAVPGPIVAPTQQNRDPYSIAWPYVEIPTASTGGDVPALIKVRMRNTSNLSTNVTGESGRIIAGLRSYDRGPAFTAYINLGDVQNPTTITIAVGAQTAFADDAANFGSGRFAQFVPGVARNSAVRVTATLASGIVQHFYGRFHAFLRISSSGVGTPNEMFLRVTNGSDGQPVDTPIVESAPGAPVMDMGVVTLGSVPGSALDQITIEVHASAVQAGDDVDFYDLVLIPIDEWAGDFTRIVDNIDWDEHLDIDSITFPKENLVALVFDSSDLQLARYQVISASDALIQANKRQRLWFTATNPEVAPIGEADRIISHTVQITQVKRYYSMRGDR